MDYSASNSALWNATVQFGIIAAAVLVANVLRRKIAFVRRSLLPTAVLAGFILLLLRSVSPLKLDMPLLEIMTYHGIAIGFIALSLRIPRKSEETKGEMVAAKSGALIVSTYLVQALLGFAIVYALVATIMPNLFPAAGILLPMGYGQGPGQANNVGNTYEQLGFVGGRSFALAIAAAGYLCACIVGIIYLNVLNRKGKLTRKTPEALSGSVTVDTFEDDDEVPIAESIDRMSVQIALVIIVYLATFLLTRGITAGLAAVAPGAAKAVSSLLWGFNFIVGSALAMLLRAVMKSLRKSRIMTHQYQNNYLLSRISGLAFDLMIVAGIASIEIGDLSGLWTPFLIMAVLGGVVTLVFLQWVCKKLYRGYYYEGLMAMYGMLTGTISSGVLLLREIDPDLRTPAANNLVTGSGTGIIFGIPMLILISLAPERPLLVVIVCAAYLTLLLLFIFKVRRRNKK